MERWMGSQFTPLGLRPRRTIFSAVGMVVVSYAEVTLRWWAWVLMMTRVMFLYLTRQVKKS